MGTPIVVSAPGKVLIAGGYLVLDPAYSGLVVSTSSRFYTVIRAETSTTSRICVRSPQFTNATWDYNVSSVAAQVTVEPSPENASKNKFVHLALQKTITLAVEVKGASSVKDILSKGTDIAIVGGNDFYSQRAQLEARNLPRTLESLSKLTPFAYTGVELANVHKTGLGSSAALITSLVSALLVYLQVIPESSLTEGDNQGRRLAHNLAQYVHCFAQGKVGSGFDVAAAVFGSHLYTRFQASVIQPLMDDQVVPLFPVISPSNSEWNYNIGDFKLPPLTRMMLADVDAGSDTPSLVGKVLKWRQESRDTANALWTTLDSLNQELAKTLLQLSELYSRNEKAYIDVVTHAASLSASEWSTLTMSKDPVISAFVKVRNTTESIRGKMREMGTLCDVPIEPIEQTKLLDACVSLPGVIGGGVPGAGGYDAIWLLVFDPPGSSEELPSERVGGLWQSYTELDVSPLLASESMAKGARIEKLADIAGLKEAVGSA
ncbi:phosphomevalonate kinase [Fistulina hepatica ATCC 64428]|uniref:Phosphomevalonate kinase n=1 Tax=Fistulina hepatica ATCC 64428 TaxID=1128425 RepID=A0A0D7AG14_9AGAR|nr:phosphomevalonate kinase [Fistulina hepatica ATCC 64428]